MHDIFVAKMNKKCFFFRKYEMHVFFCENEQKKGRKMFSKICQIGEKHKQKHFFCRVTKCHKIAIVTKCMYLLRK